MTLWLDAAACRGADPALFFPTGPTAGLVIRRTIEQFCCTCPSIVECGQAGRAEQGIWGGVIHSDRGPIGAGRTHGRRSTYVQGCRCLSCKRAYSAGRRSRT